MSQNDYFYKFLSIVSKELALLARELEHSVFTSPRMMLTHTRTLVEDIVRRIIRHEGISDISCDGLKDQIMLLQSYRIFPNDVLDSVHSIRKLGNDAAHKTIVFRYSEALKNWENLYVLLKWYMEKYEHFEVPSYQEPSLENVNKYDVQELQLRLKQIEESLLQKVSEIAASIQGGAVIIEKVEEEIDIEVEGIALPGETTIRTISYKGAHVDIPYFLRDAFLLPQRFENSERFMIALGGVQQARIMSELPNDLEGISSYVKRYKEENEELMFNDLCTFVEEEKIRHKLMLERPGELFLFFRSEHIVMTEKLAETPLNEEYFKGIPNFINQMNRDGILKVGQLPKELLILAKYERVGIGTVQKLFNQIKELQFSDIERIH